MTLYEHLTTLPNPLNILAVKNWINRSNEKGITSKQLINSGNQTFEYQSDALISAFVFEGSFEGHSFWHDEVMKPLKGFEQSKDTNVKNWYVKTYPDDGMGHDIDENITFKDLYFDLPNFYNNVAAEDTVIRERIFEKLAEITETSYNKIYNKWIQGQ